MWPIWKYYSNICLKKLRDITKTSGWLLVSLSYANSGCYCKTNLFCCVVQNCMQWWVCFNLQAVLSDG